MDINHILLSLREKRFVLPDEMEVFAITEIGRVFIGSRSGSDWMDENILKMITEQLTSNYITFTKI